MVTAHALDLDVSGADEPTPVRDTHRSVKYVVEAIGTFFLVLTVGAAAGSANPLAPLGIGAVLMVMVYAGGHLSGGHYNPAVTLAVLIRRRIALRDAFAYWIVQFGAALVAAVVVRRIIDPVQTGRSAPLSLAGHTLIAAFVVELLFTYALCYVVLNVATSKSQPNNSYYGLAIGFTVVAGAFAVGSISGAAFNPAVSLGAAGMDVFAWPTLWVYLLAQTLGGIAAGGSFLALNPDDR
jgi:aquaporin Z